MTLLRNTGHSVTIPYPVAVAEQPRATMLDGHGPIAAGAVVGVYWTQFGVAAVDPGSGKVAVAYGAATPGDDATLRIAGVVNADLALSVSAGGANVTRDVPLGVSVPPGADLWVVFVAAPTDPSDPPRLNGVGLTDRTGGGAVMTAPIGADISVGAFVTFTPLRSAYPDAHQALLNVTVP